MNHFLADSQFPGYFTHTEKDHVLPPHTNVLNRTQERQANSRIWGSQIFPRFRVSAGQSNALHGRANSPLRASGCAKPKSPRNVVVRPPPACTKTSCVPSLKEPLLSRVVSNDFVAWGGRHFACIYRQSARHVRTGFCVRSLLWVARCVVLFVSFFDLVVVLRSTLRGLFGRSFQCATVPLPIPSWTPADCR